MHWKYLFFFPNTIFDEVSKINIFFSNKTAYQYYCLFISNVIFKPVSDQTVSHGAPGSNKDLIRVIISSNSQPRILINSSDSLSDLFSREPPGSLQLRLAGIRSWKSSNSDSLTS